MSNEPAIKIVHEENLPYEAEYIHEDPAVVATDTDPLIVDLRVSNASGPAALEQEEAEKPAPPPPKKGANWMKLGICFAVGIVAWLIMLITAPGSATRTWVDVNIEVVKNVDASKPDKTVWQYKFTGKVWGAERDEEGKATGTDAILWPNEQLWGVDTPASFTVNGVEFGKQGKPSHKLPAEVTVPFKGPGTADFFKTYPDEKLGQAPTKWIMEKIGDDNFNDYFNIVNGKPEGWTQSTDPATGKLIPDKYEKKSLGVNTQVTMNFQRLHDGDYAKTGLFIGAIIGVMLAPLPLGAVAFIALMTGMMTNAITFSEAFNGFTNSVPWLIVVAYALAIPFVESGLGRRISLIVVKFLGKSTIGLAYALGLVDTIMGVGIPSISARAGGVTLPIAKELCAVAGSAPDDETGPEFGYFLHITLFQMGVINSAMFSTAVASNPIAVDNAKNDISVPVDISFATWFVAAVVPCLVLLSVIPVICYFIWKPRMKSFPDAKGFATRGLTDLGPLSVDEKWTLIAFGVAIALWLGEGILELAEIKAYSLNAVASGLVGLTILLCVGTLSWKRVLLEGAAWNTMVWFSALISLAQTIKPVMVVLSEAIGSLLISLGTGWFVNLCIVIIFYFLTHYGFASTTAHVLAMYTPLVDALISAKCPPKIAAFSLAIVSALAGCVTPYGSGSAPLYFASGFIPTKTFWSAGALFMVLNCAVMCGLGLGYYTLLGWNDMEAR